MSTKQQQVKVKIASQDLLKSLKIDQTTLTKLLTTHNYLSFSELKKDGSKRWIDAPRKTLKHVQVNIMYNLLYKISPHDSAYGFIVGRSPATGAKQHLNNKLLLMMDLSNYFPSINYGQVISAFYYILGILNTKEKTNFNIRNDSIILTHLCTYNNVLPQGAPTSPALANIITKPLDSELTKLSSANGVTYTRYADDLAFSHSDLKFDIDSFIKKVKIYITMNGFLINAKKTRVLRPHRRQSITGVVINDKLGVAKKYYKNTKAGVYNFSNPNNRFSNKQIQKLRGRIEWIRSIDSQKGNNLLTKFEQALKHRGKKHNGKSKPKSR
jgi:RNA-directed DNA polymerase